MNIAEHEQPIKLIAKTYDCKGAGTKITYSFIDTYPTLCVDKKDIITSELEACESLLEYTTDQKDRKSIEIEVAELKMALDLMP